MFPKSIFTSIAFATATPQIPPSPLKTMALKINPLILTCDIRDQKHRKIKG